MLHEVEKLAGICNNRVRGIIGYETIRYYRKHRWRGGQIFMVVNFEFLGNEPIENIVTCLHFKVDKVVFFGYHDIIEERKKSTANFLRKYCGVRNVVFHTLSQTNLQSVLRTMHKEIEHELGQGGKVYFDITGGESLILVAFGMLSKEFATPMHMYDIEKDKLIELDNGTKTSISTEVEHQKVQLNLDRYIEMKGGVIDYHKHKGMKEDLTDEFVEDATKIWEIARKYIDYWNPFSDFLKRHMKPNDNLMVSRKAATVARELSASTNILKEISIFNKIVDALEAEHILLDVEHTNSRYCFRFKNQKIKDCIWESGSILELYTYQEQKKVSDDCRVGVHLDWDGVIHFQTETDVTNEIDVLSLNGNIPTFISCKSGNMGPNQSLHALYELETVAKRFGGKYAKKILVSAKKIGNVYLERAAEMGIEVR